MRILPLKSYIPTVKGLFSNFFNREAIFPFYASFKLTARCHFGCPFCNMHTHSQIDMPTEDVKKVMDNLSRSSVLMASFEGGEPLLREDIGELLEYARKSDFYLLFTSSARDILDYPMEEYAKSIDFLHISIDEGHNNLEMFDILPELSKLPTELSVQTVVTIDTIDALEDKVEKCAAVDANIVVIPASPMDGAKQVFPDIDKFEEKLRQLKKKYPATIHTPLGYFDAYRKGKCSSASIIIAPDGKLFYPCNIKDTKRIDLVNEDLTGWLKSHQAKADRADMKACDINCGWYQYYSIDAYLSFSSIFEALAPSLKFGFGKGKK
jgi:MoaA/NifB/PqqE/SkfB family radical SAM enzyme